MNANDWIIGAVIVLTWLPAVAFPILYHILTRGNWRKSLIGYQSMEIAVVTALLLTMAIANAFLGEDWPWRDVIRPTLYLATMIALWHRLIVFLKVQRHPERYAVNRSKAEYSRSTDCEESVT